MRTKLPALLLSLIGAASFPLACSGTDDYQSGPPGTGGFNPTGATSGVSSSGAGASTSQGAGGDPGPPQCDDSLKRCAHTFSYVAGAETTVELRGDYAPDGWTAGTPMAKSGDTWTATVDVPWATDVQYKYVVDGTWIADPANPNQISDGFGGFNSVLSGVTCDEWTCVAPIGTFDWRDAVLYFVFVDRFLDGDPSNNGSPTSGVLLPADYQGGDWAGVRQRVEEGYFNELGVNTLWLSVPMNNTTQSGLGNDGKLYSAYHGYWPSDLDQTEAHFGTLTELADLVTAAHEKGLKVILDYAMNHVHDSAPIYAQHPEWFWPNSNCVCGIGCSWDGAEGKKCWFTDYLPDFNFTVQAARDYSVGNAVQWIKDTGIDGFRLDAVKHIEDAWLTDLRSAVSAQIEPGSGEHFYMVGETFTGDKATIKYYVDPVKMLDGQFDFPLRMQLASSVLMRADSMQSLDGFLAANDSYYGAGVMSTFIGNHDIPRPIHLAEDAPLWNDQWTDGKDRAWTNQPGLPGGNSAFERLANAFSILFTLKGVPLIYYGDEVGMPGAGDPDNRRMMQWTGYSAGQQLLLDHIKKLTTIRAEHPALRKGTRTSLSSTTDTLAYQMAYGGETVCVAVNRSDSPQSVGGLPSGSLTDLIGGSSVSGPSVSVGARSTMILVAP